MKIRRYQTLTARQWKYIHHVGDQIKICNRDLRDIIVILYATIASTSIFELDSRKYFKSSITYSINPVQTEVELVNSGGRV